MAIRTIRQAGDEILKKKSKEVEQIDDKIRELVEDMIETMHKYNGVGLAAPQVGILKRIAVIDLYEEENGPVTLINPEILKTEGKRTVDEGCLSFPNQFAKVVRPKKVIVEALNEFGDKVRYEAEDLFAQAISHEVDHLNGEVFIDKIIPGTLEIYNPEEEKKKKKDKKKIK